MADESGNNGGAFSSDSDGTWATDGGDTTGQYDGWTWRQIMAVIVGGSDNTGGDRNEAHAKQFSDPESVQAAAEALNYTQRVLQEVAQSISDQTEALTGDNGPWQGAAARALGGAMSGLSQQAKQMSDVLSDAPTGHRNVPQAVADNAQHLRSAIKTINDINTWYAKQALIMNPHLQMSNGLVEVHKAPQIVKMMTQDMLTVLKSLARLYDHTNQNITQPSSPTDPNTGPGQAIERNFPNSFGNIPDPFGSVPNPFGNIPGPNLGNEPNLGNDPHITSPNIPNFPGSDPTLGGDVPNLGPGANLGGDAPNIGPDANLGGDVPGLGTGMPNVKTVAGPDFSADSPGAGTLDGPSGAPSQFPGGTSLANGGPELPGAGQLDPAMDAALNPDTGGQANAPVSLAPFPNPGLGSDAPTGSAKSPKLARAPLAPFEGGTGLDTPGALDGTGGQGAAVSPFPGGMPDTSGIGAPTGDLPAGATVPAGGLGSATPDLPSLQSPGPSAGDAVAPFPGGANLADGPGLGESGAPSMGDAVAPFPGGAKLADGAGLGESGAPSGMPGMPMMPMGSGGAGLGGVGGEGGPSDASGLLGGEVAPWAGSPSLPDGVTGGAVGGGPGLSLPGGGVPEVGDPGAVPSMDDAVAPFPGGAKLADGAGLGESGAPSGMPGMP
ncbi:hypothetical protein ACFVGL_29120, partial [Streptomyces tubercidicus]